MNSSDQSEEQMTQPPTIDEAYEWAQAAFQRKDFEGAITRCRQILEVAPESIPAFGLLGASLNQSGKIGEEIDTLKQAIESNSDSPRLYANLGELQRIAGDLEGSIVSLEHAAAADPDNSFIHVSLGTAHRGKGDLAAAEKEYRRALEIDPGSAPTHYFLGRIYLVSKRPDEAIQAYSTALEHDANFPPACLGLAELLFQKYKGRVIQKIEKGISTDNMERAAELALRAIRNGVGTMKSHLLAGKILIELNRIDEANNILQTASKYGEKHPDLYVALSVVYSRLNEDDKARDISRRLLREFPVGSRVSASPEARILVLECLYGDAFRAPFYGRYIHAHANSISAVRPNRVSLHHMFIQGIKKDEIESFKNNYDVIYNNVVNAEVNNKNGYSDNIQYLLDRAELPVINPPDLIAQTTRDQNYARLHKLDHLIFPKTIKVDLATDSVPGILERVEAEFEFPILVRSLTAQNSAEIEKVDDIDALRNTLTQNASQPYYFIQYHESKYRSGNFIRTRGVFIGGTLYPGRMTLSGNWLVGNVGNRTKEKELMETSREFRDEEQRWLTNPVDVIGQANMAAFHSVDEVIGLDCYGFDFGIAEDGRAILFEANACMNCLAIRKHITKYPYLEPAVENMQRAMEELLIGKAKGTA